MAEYLKTTWEAADRNGKLGKLKEKLGLRTNENVQWSFEKLGRRESSKVFKVKLTREAYSYSSVTVSFVVKLSNNIRKEFNLLTQLHGSVPVPKPIYLCDDWTIVGDYFMVMEYVEGLHYNDISQVPSEHLKDVLTSVMSSLSVLHSGQWKQPNGGVSTYQSADFFWRDQVAMWTDNYKSVVGWAGWYFWPVLDGNCNPESYLFSEVQDSFSKPQGTTTRIHGSLDIGNVIFDDNFKVKAIIDWKYELNGDPMADLAYFLMVCLPPSPSLAGCKLLVPEGKSGLINDALKVYKQKSRRSFSDREFSYARAVCCLRCISIIKKAAKDDFKHHEIGNYSVIKSKHEAVIEFLHMAGKEFYKNWKSY